MIQSETNHAMLCFRVFKKPGQDTFHRNTMPGSEMSYSLPEYSEITRVTTFVIRSYKVKIITDTIKFTTFISRSLKDNRKLKIIIQNVIQYAYCVYAPFFKKLQLAIYLG